MTKFSTEQLPELLSFYYKRLFPYEPIYRWLTYGSDDQSLFSRREMSFTLAGDIYLRYQNFQKLEDFTQDLQKRCPVKIDIGAIYNTKPKMRRLNPNFEVVERELIFDIDLTDYDPVRTCCKEANVCNKCWKLMSIACKIIDTTLRDDFGYKHNLWVFSGRRGIHCWVCDEGARKLGRKARCSLVDYLQLLDKEDKNGKIAHIPQDFVHPCYKRALNIIEKDFVSLSVVDQNILGTVQGMQKMLPMLEKRLRTDVESAWEKLDTSLERWKALTEIHNNLQSKGELKYSKNIIGEIMLHYAYPRMDIHVSKGLNHLLKSPFCIHPKTGKICIPFNPATAFTFNPEIVPTVSELVDEIQNWDAKELNDDTKRKIKSYKKTSMYKGMQVFEEFLRNLEASNKIKNDSEESPMEF